MSLYQLRGQLVCILFEFEILFFLSQTEQSSCIIMKMKIKSSHIEMESIGNMLPTGFQTYRYQATKKAVRLATTSMSQLTLSLADSSLS